MSRMSSTGNHTQALVQAPFRVDFRAPVVVVLGWDGRGEGPVFGLVSRTLGLIATPFRLRKDRGSIKSKWPKESR